LGEVARQHSGRRDESDHVGRRLIGTRFLMGPEKEDSVRGNRSAQCTAELIAHEAVVLSLTCCTIDGGERRGRIETVMSVELEQIAVQKVGACLGNNIDGHSAHFGNSFRR
jgi:hypothetical protein